MIFFYDTHLGKAHYNVHNCGVGDVAPARYAAARVHGNAHSEDRYACDDGYACDDYCDGHYGGYDCRGAANYGVVRCAGRHYGDYLAGVCVRNDYCGYYRHDLRCYNGHRYDVRYVDYVRPAWYSAVAAQIGICFAQALPVRIFYT